MRGSTLGHDATTKVILVGMVGVCISYEVFVVGLLPPVPLLPWIPPLLWTVATSLWARSRTTAIDERTREVVQWRYGAVAVRTSFDAFDRVEVRWARVEAPRSGVRSIGATRGFAPEATVVLVGGETVDFAWYRDCGDLASVVAEELAERTGLPLVEVGGPDQPASTSRSPR